MTTSCPACLGRGCSNCKGNQNAGQAQYLLFLSRHHALQEADTCLREMCQEKQMDIPDQFPQQDLMLVQAGIAYGKAAAKREKITSQVEPAFVRFDLLEWRDL